MAISNRAIKAVSEAGAVAAYAEQRKRQKYTTIDNAIYQFQPIAIETLGAIGRDSRHFLDDLGQRLIRIMQDSRAATF